MTERSIILNALIYAAGLDALRKDGLDGAEHDAVHRVGELLGGLSVHGFVADLIAAMEREREAGGDKDDIAWFASDWLLDAEGIMLPTLNGVRNMELLEDLCGWRSAA